MVFDEADGIPSMYWDATTGMVIDPNAIWLALLNPIDLASQAKVEYDKGSFDIIHLSNLNHLNVVAGLLGVDGDRLPFPGIDMNLGWVNERIKNDCSMIDRSAVELGDFQWPPPSVNFNKEIIEIDLGQDGPIFWRPRSETTFLPRVLGQWPTMGIHSIWTEPMWMACSKEQPEDTSYPIEIGCDPSYGGKDKTSFTVRRGRTCLHIETQFGWNSQMIAQRLKELATIWGRDHAGMTAEDVLCRIDTTGSDGVLSHAEDFNFVGVNSSHNALDKIKYKNRRSELWFSSVEQANKTVVASDGSLIPMVDISRITRSCKEETQELKKQLQGTKFYLRAKGVKEVEPKDSIRKRLKASPDEADSFNLAFAPYDGETTVSKPTTFNAKAASKMVRQWGRKKGRI